jgi:hypothetical protein
LAMVAVLTTLVHLSDAVLALAIPC